MYKNNTMTWLMAALLFAGCKKEEIPRDPDPTVAKTQRISFDISVTTKITFNTFKETDGLEPYEPGIYIYHQALSSALIKDSLGNAFICNIRSGYGTDLNGQSLAGRYVTSNTLLDRFNHTVLELYQEDNLINYFTISQPENIAAALAENKSVVLLSDASLMERSGIFLNAVFPAAPFQVRCAIDPVDGKMRIDIKGHINLRK